MYLSWRQDSCCLHRTCTHWENKETVQICPFYFLSKFYSSQIFVCLTLITYWFSVHLLPLQSIHIIFEYFLLDLWLPILAAVFPDTLWCFCRSPTYSFYPPADFKAGNVWQSNLSQAFLLVWRSYWNWMANAQPALESHSYVREDCQCCFYMLLPG